MIGPATTLSVVQGTTLTRTLQGYNADGTIPNDFLNSDVLTGTVWLAQAETAIVSFTPVWFAATLCQFTVTLTGAQTATLSLDTLYNLQVFAARSGTTYCIGWVYLQIQPAAGMQGAAVPPDLITGAYAAQQLGNLTLSPAQLEQMPTIISAASAAIRRWCFDRDFTQRTYVKEFPVALNGTIRLDQIPVNQILRVQASPAPSLFIANTSSSVQMAQAYFTTTGDVATGQTVTGITLNWTSGGVLSTSAIPFAPNDVISTTAGLINAVGSGWVASTDSLLGSWPVTELIGGFAAQGCQGSPGCQFSVYSRDLSGVQFLADDGQNTGIVWCGAQYPGPGPRWGPDFQMWDQDQLHFAKVKVTYNAGFAVIPYQIQFGCVELVKAMLERLAVDMLLRREAAGEYSYEIAVEMIEALPKYVRQGISQYRILNA